MKEFASILAPKYNPKGYNIPTEEAEERDELAKMLHVDFKINNSKSREVLGIQYTELAKTICDMVDSMISAGKIKPPE